MSPTYSGTTDETYSSDDEESVDALKNIKFIFDEEGNIETDIQGNGSTNSLPVIERFGRDLLNRNAKNEPKVEELKYSKDTLRKFSDTWQSMALDIASGVHSRARELLDGARYICEQGIEHYEDIKRLYDEAKSYCASRINLTASLSIASERMAKNADDKAMTIINVKELQKLREQAKLSNAFGDDFKKLHQLQDDAQLGRNVLEFLRIINTKVNPNGHARKKDKLQFAVDAVLTSLMSPPGSKMRRSQMSIIKETKVHRFAIKRAQQFRLELHQCNAPTDVPFQSLRSQAKRSDNIDELIHHHIYNFCHDDEYVRVDSNCNREYTVYGPDAVKEDIPHVRRNWSNPGDDEVQLNLFKESSHFKALCAEAHEINPNRFDYFVSGNEDNMQLPKVYIEKFQKYVCPCVKAPTHAACVDVIVDKAMSSLEAIKNFISRKTNHRQHGTETSKLLKDLDDCVCQHCASSINAPDNGSQETSASSLFTWPDLLETDSCRSLLDSVLNKVLCPKQDHEEFTLNYEEVNFKLRRKTCSLGKCERCSTSKIPFDCPVFAKCEEEETNWCWLPSEEGANSRYPMKIMMRVKDIVFGLRDQIKDVAAHSFKLNFLKRMAKIDHETFDNETLLIYTDFASNLSHKPPKQICCGKDKHSVLAVYVVLTGRQEVTLANGEKVQFVECDTWFGFASTEEKGKMSDWVSHHAMLKPIIKHYKAKKDYRKLRMWTDNCGPQYKCRHNFFQLGKLAVQYQFDVVEHCFACIYGFKVRELNIPALTVLLLTLGTTAH